MQISIFYPVLMVEDVPATAAFWIKHFGFSTAFDCDWYVHLRHPEAESINLAIMSGDHPTIPASGRGRTHGVLINFEVDDVDAVHARLTAAGLPILSPLRDEEFGQRHFITQDPNGILIDIIMPIPPSEEFAIQYVSP